MMICVSENILFHRGTNDISNSLFYYIENNGKYLQQVQYSWNLFTRVVFHQLKISIERYPSFFRFLPKK